MEQPNKDFSYLEIFKKALNITWQNRLLWWFGFFIVLSGVTSSFSYSFDKKTGQSPSQPVWDFFAAHPYMALAIFLLLILLWLIFIILGTLGRGALIRSAYEIYENKKIGFKAGMQEGKKYFWKIILISFVVGLFNLAALIILATPVIFLFSAKSYVIGTILAIIALLIFIPLFFLTAFLKIYGYIYTVLGGLSFWPALDQAYGLLTRNLKKTVLIAVLFIPAGLLLGILMFMLVIPIVIIFFLIGLILFLIAKEIGIAITLILGGLILATIILAVKSAYEVFTQTVWILFFKEIARPKVEEKVTEKETEPEAIPKPSPMENI